MLAVCNSSITLLIDFQYFSNLVVTKLPFREETVGRITYFYCYSHKKELIIRKVKLIVHQTYQDKRTTEDVNAAVFLSATAALTPNIHSSIINDLRIHFVSRKEQLMEQARN